MVSWLGTHIQNMPKRHRFPWIACPAHISPCESSPLGAWHLGPAVVQQSDTERDCRHPNIISDMIRSISFDYLYLYQIHNLIGDMKSCYKLYFLDVLIMRWKCDYVIDCDSTWIINVFMLLVASVAQNAMGVAGRSFSIIDTSPSIPARSFNLPEHHAAVLVAADLALQLRFSAWVPVCLWNAWKHILSALPRLAGFFEPLSGMRYARNGYVLFGNSTN